MKIKELLEIIERIGDIKYRFEHTNCPPESEEERKELKKELEMLEEIKV